MKIAIIREGKVPRDRRVPLSPQQCLEVKEKFPRVELVVQSSPSSIPCTKRTSTLTEPCYDYRPQTEELEPQTAFCLLPFSSRLNLARRSDFFREIPVF